jgi:hypothetical protein
MFERFTDRARRVVVLAQEEARMLNHNYIGTEHILLGLIHEGEGVAAKALESLGISLEAVRQQVEEIIGQGQQAPSGHIPFTPRAKKVLELSLREALQLGHNYIGTEHILLGLIREGEGVAAQVLVRLGADLNRVRQQVIRLVHGAEGEPLRRVAVAEAADERLRMRRSGEHWIGELHVTLAKMSERIDAIERVLGMREQPPDPAAPAAKTATAKAPAAKPPPAPTATARPTPTARPAPAPKPAPPPKPQPTAKPEATESPSGPPTPPAASGPSTPPTATDPSTPPAASDPPTPPENTAAAGDD